MDSCSVVRGLMSYYITNLTKFGRNFTDDILKFTFLYKNCCILIQISFKFSPKIPINNNTKRVQIMARDKRQVFAWTNDGQVLDLDGLKDLLISHVTI